MRNLINPKCVGASQNQGSYYKRLHEYFNKHKLAGSERSQLAIQGRWGIIQRDVNKFCGHKLATDHRNESGKNEQDRVSYFTFAYFKDKCNIV
jgi:hypothetical protein